VKGELDVEYKLGLISDIIQIHKELHHELPMPNIAYAGVVRTRPQYYPIISSKQRPKSVYGKSIAEKLKENF
jgi:hypothetical protein